MNDIMINGIAAYASGGFTIAGGAFNENSDGITAVRSHGTILLQGSTLNRNGDDGLDIYNSDYFEVVDSEFIDNNPSGGIHGDGNGIKVGVGGPSVSVIRGTLIAGNPRRGIDIVISNGASAIVEHVTVVNNGNQGIMSAEVIKNSISWDNAGNDIAGLPAGGDYSNIIHGSGSVPGGTDIWRVNPQFNDADNYDFTLDPLSPGVDAGVDLGQPYSGTAPDLGAFEVTDGVIAAHLFYNNSILDGNNADANASDDNAIAAGKSALLPGQTATFANYTNYSRGINGIMVDIDDPAGTATAADFDFKAGTDPDPSNWAAAPVPSITVRPGAGVGGSDRVTIIWADYAVRNQWLAVTVKAGGNIGLPQDEVFYFGNIVGDTDGDGQIGSSDYSTLLGQLGRSGSGLTADFNCDARTDLSDFMILRAAYGYSLSMPTVPGSTPAGAPQALASPAPQALASPVSAAPAPTVSPSTTSIIAESPGSDFSDKSLITPATSGPEANLLIESEGNYMPQSQPITVGSMSVTPHHAPTIEEDWGALSNNPPSDESVIGLDTLADANAPLLDLMAESPILPILPL